MRMLSKFSMISLGALLVACSDMTVDSSQYVVGTTNPDPSAQISVDYFTAPEDFDLDTYIEINPDVKYHQLKVAIRSANAAFMDSTKMTMDSVMAEDGTLTTIAKIYLEKYKADTSDFIHSDTSFTHKVFLMAGYGADLWEGADSLNSEQRNVLVHFNLIQSGTPSVKKDKEYINNFKYEKDLMENHYVAFGLLEGRAYRYCKDGELGMLKSEIVPDTLGTRPRIMDYNAYRFCLNKKDGMIYSIK